MAVAMGSSVLPLYTGYAGFPVFSAFLGWCCQTGPLGSDLWASRSLLPQLPPARAPVPGTLCSPRHTWGSPSMASTFVASSALFSDSFADGGAGLGLGLLSLLAVLLNLLGITALLGGAYAALVRLLSSQAAPTAEARRPPLGPGPVFLPYLLSGLEFLIAGCLVRLVAAADWQLASVLASLVVARTLLGLCSIWVPAAALASQQPMLPPTRSANQPAQLAACQPVLSESTNGLSASAGQ
jgi:hypothetical protein